MEHHKYYKSKWDEGVRGLAHVAQEPEANDLEGIHAQLAHVFKHGTCEQSAKAVICAAKAVWAHCELHEDE